MKKIILTFCIFHSALGISNAQTISLDSTFGIGGKVFTHFEPYGAQASVNSIVLQSDGKIVVAGSRESHYGVDNIDILLSRYNSNGTLDNTFGIGGKVVTDINSADDYACSVTIQADDKIVVAGTTGADFALLRYNSNGSLDNTFGIGGIVKTDLGGDYDYGRSVAIQTDGKIVVAGENGPDFALARYKSNGTLDSTFDYDGKVTTNFVNTYDGGYSVVIQSDGKIIVTGASWNGISQHFALARYNNDGSLDNAFGTSGKVITVIGGLPETQSAATSVLLQSDGKIIAAGYYLPPSTDLSDSYSRFAVARYNNNGSLDTTFDSDGIVITPFGTKDAFGLSAAIQSDGKIIVTGFGYLWGVGFMLARYNTNGSLDNSFGTGGIITAKMRNGSDRSYSIAVQNDDKIVVAGKSQNDINWYETDFVVVRYNNNIYAPPPSPTAIPIAVGGGHSLFLCSNNTGMACGYNYYGQLGDGTTVNKSTPAQINALSDIVAISSSYHSLFLKNNGTVWACGMNYYGQLGDGTNVHKSTPIQTSSLSDITAVSAGDSHSLFLKNDGTVWACGFNDFLQLGDGSSTDKSTPIQLTSLSGIKAISAGYQHSLFLKNDGTVWACGTNTSGALGDGTTIAKGTPIQVSSLTGITAIAAGVYFSLFLKNDGTVWASGQNASGTLGDGTNINKSTPVQTTSLSGITAIAGHNDHSVFLKNDGSVWACGQNSFGELGDGTIVNKSTPVQVSSLSGITAIAAGVYSSFFLKNDGTVWACGYNGYGQLGDGTNVNKSTPVQVIGLCMTCAPPQAPTAANATLCANNTANLSAIGTGILGWYNQAIGGTYLGGGTNYTTPILTASTTYYVQDSTCAASATRKAVIVTVNPLPVVIANATATNLCEGNPVTLTGGGASSYIWSGGVSNGIGFIPAATTTYTVTGTDGNNCSNTTTKTINVNHLPTVTANASVTNLCEGSPVTLTGVGASSYTWSGGVTNGVGFVPTATTTYTVTGTDGNNCSNIATKTIHVNPLPTVTANASANNVCKGASIIISGGGATTYIWSGGAVDGISFVPSITATYTVTGTDGNNCSNTATKTINVNPLPTVTATASATNVCEGTIVTLTGGGAASYIWSDGIANGVAFVASTTATYTVTGTDGNNCSNTATKTINVTPLLDLTTSLSGLTISANQNGAIYTWLNCNNGNSVIAGATSQSYTASINGNYAVIVKMNSCSDTSTCVNVSITGIEKIAENNIQLKVFPNPGNGSITVTLSGVEGQSANEGIYTIKNESGQMIQTFKLHTSNNYTINIENLSNGIYFIVGLNGNQMINQKVVIAK
jgi:uncharacterized delta-60 repeat protein